MVVVRFVPETEAADRDRLFRDLGAFDVRALPWADAWSARISRRTTRDAVETWSDSPIVDSIEPNGFYFASGPVPGDPEFPRQWHLRNVGQPVPSFGPGTPGADIVAPRAWCSVTGDSSVVVAVLDTGVDWTHPDLAARIFANPGEIPGNGVDDDLNGKIDDVRGWDFEDHFTSGGDNDPMDTYGHGTLVAGTVAAALNGEGSVGVAPGVTILPVRVLTETSTSPPSGTHLQAALGIHYAVEMGADFVNCSFGSYAASSIVRAAIEEAETHDVMVICAAGNDANDNDVRPFYPASFPLGNVISVTATDPDDRFVSSFANFGATTVDLAAPGIDIRGTVVIPSNPYELYGSSSGTSFAAPQVTGALALLASFLPGLDHPTPREVLLANVRAVPSLSGMVARVQIHGRFRPTRWTTEDKNENLSLSLPRMEFWIVPTGQSTLSDRPLQKLTAALLFNRQAAFFVGGQLAVWIGHEDPIYNGKLVETLVKHLDTLDGARLIGACRFLEQATGMVFGAEPEKWKSWWGSWHVVDGSAAGTDEHGAPEE